MKKKVLLPVVAAIAVVAAVAAVNLTSGPLPLNVNDVRSGPATIQGPVTIAGVMAAVSEVDPKVFGLMDKAELVCKSPNCEKFFLPVRFEGPRPGHGDEVEATGTFTHGGQLFSASAVKVVRNHKL